MMKNENHERELLLKQLIRHSINDQIEALKSNKKESNSSFVFLDSSTLNMLILYLLMNSDGEKSQVNKPEAANSNDDPVTDESMGELDELISNRTQEFEEVLALLKEKL
ncbi:hypothetical protein LG329_03395 [Virgibacillus necropolis]|uniref:hypothetical protein n=1 Tax=Virgibacillus necropolis TaxID=163877 RepID=UPI00384F0E79